LRSKKRIDRYRNSKTIALENLINQQLCTPILPGKTY